MCLIRAMIRVLTKNDNLNLINLAIISPTINFILWRVNDALALLYQKITKLYEAYQLDQTLFNYLNVAYCFEVWRIKLIF